MYCNSGASIIIFKKIFLLWLQCEGYWLSGLWCCHEKLCWCWYYLWCCLLSETLRYCQSQRERERELPANLSVLVANSLLWPALLSPAKVYTSVQITTNLLLRWLLDFTLSTAQISMKYLDSKLVKYFQCCQKWRDVKLMYYRKLPAVNGLSYQDSAF